MADYKLSFTASEIDKRLSAVDTLETTVDDIQSEIGEVRFDEDLTEMFGYFAGYLNKNGNTVAYAPGGTTDFIKVEPGDVFIWSGSTDLNGCYDVVEYDANKNFISGNTLATESYVRANNIRYTVISGSYVRFSTVSASGASLLKTRDYDGLTTLEDKTSDYLVGATEQMLNRTSDYPLDYLGAVTTPAIPVKAGDVFLVSCSSEYYSCGGIFYHADGSVLTRVLYNEDMSRYIASKEKIVTPKGASYVRFCSLYSVDYPLQIKRYIQLPLKHADYKLYELIEKIQPGNVLYGKKYVACGDSFTEGPFSEKTDETWDEGYQVYKTYPYWIASRNKMVLVNEAKSGSDFTNIEGASNAFSVSRYLDVPTDADYITLMFGLNETNIGSDSALIGTKDDTTNTTLWGAYNVVFEHFLTNMPFAKIGVIIADAWMTENYATVVKEICEYWGIPYLDLKGENIPMGIAGKYTETSAKAKELRNAAFQVSKGDSHPNPKAHKYRSTIIENFMRGL